MNPKVKTPKYRIVEKYLISMIAENNYPPGTLLPSEPALCKKFKVSRNTIRQAIGNLIRQGIIYNEHGRGTFVAEPKSRGNPDRTHQDIGIVLHDVEQLRHPFFSEYLHGIQEEMDLHESTIHLIFSHESSPGELDFSREKDVMGLILISGNLNEEYILSLQARRIPFVSFTSPAIHKKIPTIFLDKGHGMYLAVEHLVKLGHRQIGYVAGDPAEKVDYDDKLQGYLNALKDLNIPINKSMIVDGFYSRVGAEQAVQKLIKRSKKPTAIVFANDIMAISVLSTLQDMGFQVPRDISVVGFDDIAEASSTKPPLTTVHVPMARMGREAARILFDLIERKDTTMIYQVSVEPEFRVRETTAPIKVKN